MDGNVQDLGLVAQVKGLCTVNVVARVMATVWIMLVVMVPVEG